MYIHERNDWPHFAWDAAKVSPLLAAVRYEQGRLLGVMASLGFQLCQEAMLLTLTEDALKTSKIEGEVLDLMQVRSSLARRLGLSVVGMKPSTKQVDGVVAMLLDATTQYEAKLTQSRLFAWHESLFPDGGGPFYRVHVGEWRRVESGPMQVVSGPLGREKIHFEAPDAQRLPLEMKAFIHWFNGNNEPDLVIKSALAHFWFVTIHPFDDGNGRIARALADLLLARSENSSQRFYSMSSQIQRERTAYYQVLEACQKDGLDITPWLVWYLQCLKGAILASSGTLTSVVEKAMFWKQYEAEAFNERQRKMLNLLFEGFTGSLTSSKWAKITKCSQDTALRDITDLLHRGILSKTESSGRSTGYQLLRLDA